MRALRTALTQHFNEGELRTLCADLGIDYENLPGDAKSDKARELVAYAERYGRTAELLTYVRRERPHLSLPAAPPVAAPPADSLSRSRTPWMVGAIAVALIAIGAAAALQFLPANAPPAAPAATATPTVAELEATLARANILLSDAGEEQEQNVRDYMVASHRAYYLLAINSLSIVGERRFTLPLYLDELDARYTALVGEPNYVAGPETLHQDALREAMLDAWNNHHGEEQVSLDAILAPR
jgi:hypothetical protein